MDQLSSCYFCGGALDTSLSEYPVVPTELRGADEDSLTVVLCPTCRRKLGRVVEEIVAATEGGAASTATEGDDTAEYDGTGFEPIGTDGEDDAAGGLLGDSDDSLRDASPAENEATGSAEPTAKAEATTADDADDNGGPETTSDDTTEGGGESETADDSDPGLTRLEYNKVMRLLQNRQLPVDRAEIRDVATSAYDIDPGEFDAVIDAAIERGLIAESNGQFVDPDGQR